MIDAHVHIERGPYEISWINHFIDQAIESDISELYLLEHSHRFIEFDEMYSEIQKHNEYQSYWFGKKERRSINEYIKLINNLREMSFPIKIKFGLEICYLPGVDRIIYENDFKNKFDFLTGSVHWISNWGFDHRKEFWIGKDVDSIYLEYYKLINEAIESKLFNIIAHPDSIKCFNYYPSFDQGDFLKEISINAKKNNMKMEQSCGLFNNYNHTLIGLNQQFLDILKFHDVEIITASDAHRPEDVGKNIKKAFEIMNRI